MISFPLPNVPLQPQPTWDSAGKQIGVSITSCGRRPLEGSSNEVKSKCARGMMAEACIHRRAVRFDSKRPKVVLIDKKTTQDKENMWYSQQELNAIHRNNRALLSAARSKTLDHSQDCVRGLERMRSKRVFYERRSRRTAIVREIVLQQKKQRYTGNHDPEAIKVFSMMCSKGERDRAIELGAYDAAAAATCNRQLRKRTRHCYELDSQVQSSSCSSSPPRRKRQLRHATGLCCIPSPIVTSQTAAKLEKMYIRFSL